MRKIIKLMNESQDIIRVDEENLNSKLLDLFILDFQLERLNLLKPISNKASERVKLFVWNDITGFDWREFLENVLKKSDNNMKETLDMQTWIRVWNHIKLIETVYTLKNVTEDEMKSYASLKVLEEYGSYASERIREIFEGWNLKPGLEDKTTRRRFCFKMFVKEFEFIASRIMIKKNLLKEDKDEATRMIEEVYHALYSNVIDVQWIDDSTRTRALQKMKQMKIIVGNLDWYMNNTIIDEYYGITDAAIYHRLTKASNYVRSMLYFKQLQKKNQIRRFLERKNQSKK